MSQITEIPLPKKWPEHVKSAVLHTISLASMAYNAAHGWVAKRLLSLFKLDVKCPFFW